MKLLLVREEITKSKEGHLGALLDSLGPSCDRA